MTSVLALTSRTHSPVITWWHLYWLKDHDTCTGFNIKNSLTCDHLMTHVLASRSWHLYWLQHQELTHLWSPDVTCTGLKIMTSVLASTSRTLLSVITWWHLYWLKDHDICTGFNIKNSVTCDHLMSPVLA